MITFTRTITKTGAIISPFYRWENWGRERQHDLSRDMPVGWQGQDPAFWRGALHDDYVEGNPLTSFPLPTTGQWAASDGSRVCQWLYLWDFMERRIYHYTEKTKIYKYKHVNINIAIQRVSRRYNSVNVMKCTLK